MEVKFFAYKGTMQEVCLRLMGKKLLVALAMEGKFASEGLQAIDGDDDMLTAMARELVENKGIGESADSIWRNVQQLRPSTSALAEEEPVDTPIEREELGLYDAAVDDRVDSRHCPRGDCQIAARLLAQSHRIRPTVALLTGQPKPRFCSREGFSVLQSHPHIGAPTRLVLLTIL